MDCSPPASSVYGISQARILEWAAISFSNTFSWHGIFTETEFIELYICDFWSSWLVSYYSKKFKFLCIDNRKVVMFPSLILVKWPQRMNCLSGWCATNDQRNFVGMVFGLGLWGMSLEVICLLQASEKTINLGPFSKVLGELPCGPVAKTQWYLRRGSPSLIPGQGTWSHMMPLKQQRSKICTATKTNHR